MMDRIFKQESVTLNVIHGDLNIYNILRRLGSELNEPVALINPRSVPLLGDS